jgi:hypothetical protein
MRNDSDKSCRENQNTYVQDFVFPKIMMFFKIMWKNIVQPDRPQMTVWRMDMSGWIHKATNSHSECVIHIAFPRKKWFALTRLKVA